MSVVDQARRQGIGTLLTRSAARTPDRVALVWREREETFAELDTAVNRTAHALLARGVGPGERIALLTHNCRELVLAYVALARIGAISVPINFMLGSSEVAFILGHAGATGLIVEDALGAVAAGAEVEAGVDLRVKGWIPLAGREPAEGWEDVTAWSASGPTDDPGLGAADDDPVQLMYTSGTESRPKGVALSSRALIAQYVSCIVDGGMSAGDIEVHALPLYHCAQLHCFLTPDLYLGATSILLSGAEPAALLAAVERHRATKLFAPPTVWISLLRHPAFDATDLSSLRKGYYGASAMPVEVLKELSARLPGVRLWNFYGQTEMSPLATILGPDEQLSRPASAGRPALNVETRVVDDDDRPVGVGEVGEIVHRSPQAMTRYWRDEERTAAAFAGGWFHSGDLGVMDADGYLRVVDRKKDMIKTGGENVASREVEEALFAHPAVSEVAVFGVPHPHWVEAVAAAVVVRDGATLTESELISFARAGLAGYKVPKSVAFVDELPKNPSGKILKRELRSRHAG